MKVKFEDLKNAVWCWQCENVHILGLEAEHIGPCSAMFEGFNRVADVFANLYYLLKGQNFKDFIYQLDRSTGNRVLFNKTRRKVEAFWGSEMPQDLKDSFHCNIEEPKRLFYDNTIEEAVKPVELLFYMMSWLMTLDDYFGFFYSDYLIIEDYCPIVTRRGELVFRLQNEVTMRLNDLRSAVSRNNARVGVDFLNIANWCNNVDVFTDDSNYRVSHIPIHSTMEKRECQDEKFGLIPGEIMEPQNIAMADTGEAWGGKRRFAFTGINEPEYHLRKEQALKGMLKNCAVIVMPELATPLDYQLAYGDLLSQERCPQLLLLAPGSFHMRRRELFLQTHHLPLMRSCRMAGSENPIYNAALIYDRRGNILAPVAKTNRFEYDGLVEDITYECGLVSIFETRIGRIAVLICVDFLLTGMQRLLSDRMVDFVFVMSMTPRPHEGEFKRAAERLSNEIKAIIIICNNNALWKQHRERPNIVIAVPGAKAKHYREEYCIISLDTILSLIPMRSGSKRLR
ncbi:MAG: hypothetical protein ABFD08_04375 [Syntrophomonas sp.]